MVTISDGIFAPDYYKNFRCMAAACRDCCCKVGWAIPIDPDSAGFYGARVENFMQSTAECDGERVFRLRKDGSCVFYDSDGLCRLMKETGRQCEICTKYPRFFEEYDGFTEAGLSASCPAAEELILNYKDYPYEGLNERQTDDRLLDFLVKTRAAAAELIHNDDPDRAAERLCGFSADLQRMIDYDCLEEYDGPDYVNAYKDWKYLTEDFLEDVRRFIFENTEILSSRWQELTDPKKPMAREFAGTKEQRRAYLEYLLYRRYLKAINSEFLYAECVLIWALYGLAARIGEDYFENVRLIAREIEHNDENMRRILEFISDNIEDD